MSIAFASLGGRRARLPFGRDGSVGRRSGKLRRRSVIQVAVWSLFVMIHHPALGQVSCVPSVSELIYVRNVLRQPTTIAFTMLILNRLARPSFYQVDLLASIVLMRSVGSG